MDNRNIKFGFEIPSEGYSDQPYVVKTNDGAWLMCVTTGKGFEGETGQHVITAKSYDKGQSWVCKRDVEVADKPESSYAVLYKTKYGRIYCFYNYNADNVRSIVADDPPIKGGIYYRVDSLGHFVFKYSDDNGESWSEKYYDIPLRKFEVDRINPYNGELLYFWNVGKPLEIDDGVCVPLYKIGRIGFEAWTNTEGVLLHCENINKEKDPEKLSWETLPDGDIGIRTPRDISHVSEEHSFVRLSDGTIFCVFRTISTYPYCAYSSDNGHTFTEPERMTYADGSFMRHPRAANFIWKCGNGKYFYWFHNNCANMYDYRNPVWVSGAVEYDTPNGKRLKFSQPDILIYDEDTHIRISYPDMVEDGGEYYITETQKDFARSHKVEKPLIENLWAQFDEKAVKRTLTKLSDGDDMPILTEFITRDTSVFDNRSKEVGGSFAFTFDFTAPKNDALLFTTMNSMGKGIEAKWNSEKNKIEFVLSDGARINSWNSDRAAIIKGKKQKIAILVDGGARAIEFVIDGKLYDGSGERIFGFGMIDRYMMDANGSKKITVGKNCEDLQISTEFLSVSEAVILQK